MNVPLNAAQGYLRGFVIARTDGRDFTARDRAAARQLQPLLVRVDNHLRELRRIRSLLPDPQGCRASAYGLTPRQTTVLALLADNLTAASIAHRLGISVSTVNTHLERLYRKLGTNNRLTTVLLRFDPASAPQPPWERHHRLNLPLCDGFVHPTSPDTPLRTGGATPSDRTSEAHPSGAEHVHGRNLAAMRRAVAAKQPSSNLVDLARS